MLVLVEDELLHTKGNKLYVSKVSGLWKELLKETYDTQWAGHLGRERMYALLSHFYYWLNMEDDIEACVKAWDLLVRQTRKAERGRTLQPLHVAKKPWVFVSMDFIFGFSKVNGLSSVLVVVDKFSKYVNFIIAPHPCTTEQTIELSFRNVVKYFKLLEEIISDHDTKFTRKLTALFGMLCLELRFSIANHPQRDGQTERVNALLEEYLRYYVTTT